MIGAEDLHAQLSGFDRRLFKTHLAYSRAMFGDQYKKQNAGLITSPASRMATPA